MSESKPSFIPQPRVTAGTTTKSSPSNLKYNSTGLKQPQPHSNLSKDDISKIVDHRADVLYNDHKVRQRRKDALEQEKKRIEDEYFAKHQKMLNQRKFKDYHNEDNRDDVYSSDVNGKSPSTGCTKKMSSKEFDAYWQNRTKERQEHLQARIQEKMIRDRQKEKEELDECTFRPFLAAKDAFMRKRIRTRLRFKKIISELAVEQSEHVDMLESLHQVENNVENRLKQECEVKLEGALEKNTMIVEEFLKTEKGNNLMKNRTQAYMKANTGLDHTQAEQEAITDILSKNKDNIKDRIIEEFRQKRLAQRRNLAIRKIQVIMELQKVEIRYQELAMDVKKHHDVIAAIQSLEYDAEKNKSSLIFKPDLVASLKQESWFLLAVHIAKQSAND